MKTHEVNCIILFFMIAIIFLFFFVIVYNKEKSKILLEAETAFCEAVHDDLSYRQAKKKISFLSYESSHADKYKKMTVTDNFSMKEIPVDTVIEKLNVDEDKVSRMLQTVLALKQPVSADSLTDLWQKKLCKKGIVAETYLCMKSVSTADSLPACLSSPLFLPMDILPVRYAGLSNEIEFHPFIRLSFFSVVGHFLLYILLGLSVIGLILFFFIRFRRVKPSQAAVEEEIKESGVSKDMITAPAICFKGRYKLTDSVWFDSDNRLLHGEVSREVLMLQQSKILRLFLEADDYRLSSLMIMKGIWGQETSTDRLYTSISRLRASLKKVDPSLRIEIVDINCYQLIVA